MKIAVVGSRDFDDYEFLKKILNYHLCQAGQACTQIISGGARGADTLAKQYAVEHGLDIQEFIPNWDVHGKSAGYLRNEQIVNACDELVAFCVMSSDGISPGTKLSIELAEKAGKPVYKYLPPESDIMEGIGI